MTRYLFEDLEPLIGDIDPNHPAVKEAARKGLVHVGFGRFEDPKVGQITHIVQNEKLIPFKKAVKTNTFKDQRQDELGAYMTAIDPAIQSLHTALAKHYGPEKYSNSELQSLNHFTTLGYDAINKKLGSLPSGIHSGKIEPEGIGDPTPDHITNMDEIMKKSRSPHDFSGYIKLGADHDLNNFQVGKAFRFKTFRNMSIHPGSVISTETDRQGTGGRPQVAALQVHVKKNARGVYAHDFSSNPKGDFILPRGAKLHIVGGPRKIVGSDAATGDLNREIVFYDAVHKS